MLKGIDISHHQRNIDLSKIETDFVICKATEGNGYTDKCCDKFYQQAKKLGKKLGVYHFARPDLGNTAKAEADWFLKETEGYHNEAILVLDWEAKALNYPISWAKEWMDRVYQKTGVRPILYISESPANSKDWSSVANANYGIWVAKYSSKVPSLKHWKFYCMWQYTSKGSLQGYNGNLDLDYFYGDAEAWDKYAGKTTSEVNIKPTPVPTESVPVSTPSDMTYTVVRGDTLSGIASKYGTTYQKLASYNGISKPNKIYPGQVIKIPGNSSNVFQTSSSITYIVKKDDTLSKIASKYGTTVGTIASLNPSIKNVNKIYPGQKIRVK